MSGTASLFDGEMLAPLSGAAQAVKEAEDVAPPEPASEPSNKDLPEGWTETRLTEVCRLIRGVSFEKGEERRKPQSDYIPLLRAALLHE